MLLKLEMNEINSKKMNFYFLEYLFAVILQILDEIGYVESYLLKLAKCIIVSDSAVGQVPFCMLEVSGSSLTNTGNVFIMGFLPNFCIFDNLGFNSRSKLAFFPQPSSVMRPPFSNLKYQTLYAL